HVVQSGDTLIGIARQHGITVAELKAANNLTHSTIVVGRELTVPNRGEAPPKHKQYVVKSGDTLWQIAKRHQVSVQDNQKWNTLNSMTPLKVGQVLSLNAQST